MQNPLKIELPAQRIFGLDILRALAILFVVFGHARLLLPTELSIYHDWFIPDGVSLFFVLSGFLIGGILIRLLENNTPTSKLLFNFWIRRWFRTLPNYFLILILLLALNTFRDPNFSFHNIGRYFIFAQNLFYTQPDFFPEAWSLSVEEWFYLIVPVCIFTLIWRFRFKPSKAIIGVVVFIILATTIFRSVRFLYVDLDSVIDWDGTFRKQVFMRLDSLMFGVLGAYMQHYKPQKWLHYKFPLFLLGIALFVLSKVLEYSGWVAFDSFYNCVFSFTVVSLATLFLLPHLSTVKQGKGLVGKSVTFISIISYSMYLLNLSVIMPYINVIIPWGEVFNHNLTAVYFARYFTYWAIVIVTSTLLYKYFEVPMTRLRDAKAFNKM
ncbi:MAG: hypothetical protein CL843_14990 [Crocinitomicaceae bacterium]|nr:hypothetical protein [Crocinitomicaceae bacterium]